MAMALPLSGRAMEMAARGFNYKQIIDFYILDFNFGYKKCCSFA